jgi:uncharacterized protein (DUF58 family)
MLDGQYEIMKSRFVTFLLLLFLSLCLSGCPIQSPMEMRFHISPEPIVGRDVSAIVKLRSIDEAPHTKLEFNASEGIEFLSGATEFEIKIPVDQWVEYQIHFRVVEEGIHIISAYAFNTYDPESSSGFGAGKTLYIQSSVIEAIVSETEISE